MMESPNGYSQTSLITVLDYPSNQPSGHFKIDVSPFMGVQVSINIGGMYEAIRTKVQASLINVFEGRALDDVPFEKARIKPSAYRSGKDDPNIVPIFERVVRDATKREVVLLIQRLMTVHDDTLIEGVVLAFLDLDEEEVVTIASGDRRKILKANSKRIETKIYNGSKKGRSVRGCEWNTGKSQIALELNDVTVIRIEELQKARRKLFPVGEPRRFEAKEEWGRLRSENEDLSDVLDYLDSATACELALEHVCNVLGTNASDKVRKQISIARGQKKRSSNTEKLSPLEIQVHKIVDAVIQKSDPK
jgi:hypothetical protein